MSCDLTSGRGTLECRDLVGGIKAAYFFNYGAFGTASMGTEDEITDVSATSSCYKYALKGSSSFEQTITTSRENGTAFFSQAINLTLPKLDKVTTKEVKLMAYGRPHIVIETYNEKSYMFGLKNGCDVTGGTIVSGGAMGDLNGYTLTFTGEEVLPANEIEGGVADDPFAGFSVDITITE